MRKFKKANTILFKLLTLFLKFFFKEGIEFAVDKLVCSEVTYGISASNMQNICGLGKIVTLEPLLFHAVIIRSKIFNKHKIE